MTTKLALAAGLNLTAAIASLGTAAPAEARDRGGTVTLSSAQWQAIQQELAQLHKDVAELKAQQAQQTQAAPPPLAAATRAQAPAPIAADAAPPPIATWAKDTKISGRMYFNVSNVDRTVNGAKTESDGGFAIKRLYLGVDHKFNAVLSANVTADVKEIGGVGQAFYVKKAYLQAKLSPALAVRLGSSDLPWIPYVEGIYGYRYVEPVVADRTGFGTSADWGVHVLGDLAGGILSYQVSAVDGGGYRNPQFSQTVDLEGRLSARYKGFNAAVGGYTGRLGKDRDGAAPALHTARRFDALVAYKDKRFTAGGEYFWARNWTQITLLPEDTAEGWSVFGSVAVVPKLSVFGRYDWVKPHEDTIPALEETYLNGGVQYAAFDGVDLALVYKHDRARNGTIDTSNGTIGGSTRGTYDEFGLWGAFQF